MRPKKHEGFDRTGDFCSRVKMSQDLAQVINDGLKYYEDHQFDENEDQHESWIDTSKNVSVISQAEFDKLKTKTPEKMQPPPTPLNTPAANGEVEPSTSAANRHVRPNQPHFYPVTKEPTTPSQGQPRKRKTRHSQNPPVEMHVGWILDSREHPPKLRNDSISEDNEEIECGSQAESLGSSSLPNR